MQARARLGLGLAAAGVVAGLALWWAASGRHPARPFRGGITDGAPPAVATGGPAGSMGPLSARPAGALWPAAPAGPPAPSSPVRGEPPVGPELLPPVPAPTFAAEARDPAWADAHERELAVRLRAVDEALDARGVAVQLGAPECRRSMCRVVIGAADSAALAEAFDLLESEDGLDGWADAMLLEGVVTGADGRVETRVTAQFGRDDGE